jgi:hypothetical protein
MDIANCCKLLNCQKPNSENPDSLLQHIPFSPSQSIYQAGMTVDWNQSLTILDPFALDPLAHVHLGRGVKAPSNIRDLHRWVPGRILVIHHLAAVDPESPAGSVHGPVDKHAFKLDLQITGNRRGDGGDVPLQ